MGKLIERRKKQYVTRKVVRDLIIFNVLIFILLQIALNISKHTTKELLHNRTELLGIAVILILFNLMMMVEIIRFYNEKFELNETNRFLNFMLDTETYRIVIPIISNKESYENELIKIAKFYAKLDTKKDCVSIKIQFNNAKKMWHYRNVTKENFKKFYKFN